MTTGIGRINRIALRFDGHGQSRKRQLFGKPGFRRLTVCIQLSNGKGWISITPDAKTGMDITHSGTRPALNPGDFQTAHGLGASDDVALARLFLGRSWWQGPWTIRGLRKLLARQSDAAKVETSGGGGGSVAPFRPIDAASGERPVPHLIKQG